MLQERSDVILGEKIKDLYPIHVGSSEFMIELNKGNSSEERLIHVQNKKFRYEFKESVFLIIAGNILRAKLKLGRIRSVRAADSIRQKNLEEPAGGSISQASKLILRDICRLMGKYDIDYRVIETGEKFASIIIFNDDYTGFQNLIRKDGDTTILEHPYGRMFGYKFLYQMKPFELVKYKGLYIEFVFQLPCMSLSPKTWMPLENGIQQCVWNNLKTDNDIKYIDDMSLLIFKICQAVFKVGYFTDETKSLINRLMGVVDRESLRTLLKEVFFLFTDQLLELISQQRYDEIVYQYVTFCDY